MNGIRKEHTNPFTNEVMPPSPAFAPYAIFMQSSETVRSSVIIGLGSKLQVMQAQQVRDITSYNEIDLELPGKQKCAYFCIVSDQDSTFEFLSSLFFSFLFIKLIRYADSYATSPIGRRAATMLFPLETSIPTAFISLLLLIGYGVPPFTHCLFNLLGDASAQGGSTCANRMLRMKEAADGLLCGRVSPRS